MLIINLWICVCGGTVQRLCSLKRQSWRFFLFQFVWCGMGIVNLPNQYNWNLQVWSRKCGLTLLWLMLQVHMKSATGMHSMTESVLHSTFLVFLFNINPILLCAEFKVGVLQADIVMRSYVHCIPLLLILHRAALPHIQPTTPGWQGFFSWYLKNYFAMASTCWCSTEYLWLSDQLTSAPKSYVVDSCINIHKITPSPPLFRMEIIYASSFLESNNMPGPPYQRVQSNTQSLPESPIKITPLLWWKI